MEHHFDASADCGIGKIIVASSWNMKAARLSVQVLLFTRTFPTTIAAGRAPSSGAEILSHSDSQR